MRRSRPFSRTGSAALLGLAIVGLSACDLSDGDDRPAAVPFETLEVAGLHTVTQPGFRVFRTPSDWQDFWQGSAAPAVDFDTFMLVGLFWGQRSGCTTDVDAVRRVTRYPESLRIETDPLPPEPCQALVYPRQIIQLATADLPVLPAGAFPQ